MSDAEFAKIRAELVMYQEVWTKSIEAQHLQAKAMEELAGSICDLRDDLKARPQPIDKFFDWTKTSWSGRIFIGAMVLIALTSFKINLSEVAKLIGAIGGMSVHTQSQGIPGSSSGSDRGTEEED